MLLAMAALRSICPAVLLLILACHSFAKLNNVEMSALQHVGEALGYSDSAFYTDPCNSSAIQCDATNTTVVKLSFYNLGLTGVIPEALGSLSNLTILNLGINNLIGPLPLALVNLTLLTYLNLGTNKLNGSLPQGLGNLSLLTELYADNQLTGTIPSSIGQLTKLQKFTANHNYLNGSIPSQLGDCLNLTILAIGKNAFSGSIPSSIGQLTKLQEFTANHNYLNGSIPSQLGDCLNLMTLAIRENAFSGGTDFLQNLKNLQYLDLSYNQFSGTIFKTLQGLTSLTETHLRKNNFSDSLSSIPNKLGYLDLAFNQITGSIPQNFGGNSLQFLFLDHNNLMSEVPNGSFSSMPSLQMLDFSHNALSGSTKFRSYLGNAEINFAFNYLTDASLKTFSCNFSSTTLLDHCSPFIPGNLQKFAINAGGDNSSTFENLQFQSDWEKGFGFHFGNGGSSTWAVESSENSSIVKSNLTELADIYRSMRSSDKYLAYHGSQLLSGTYNVTLYFAEIEGDHSGYRVFDVYIQGRLIRKDLDVFALVQKNASYVIYNETEVTSGILSVQLIYDGKSSERSGPMISALSAVLTKPSGTPLVPDIPRTSSASIFKHKPLIVSCSIALLVILIVVGSLILWLRKKKRHVLEYEQRKNIGVMEYKYAALCKATNNFSELSKIGEGGFGSVYKGVLPNGCAIAIKRLHPDRNARQEEEFKKEIQLISMIRHQNLVGILGYCTYSHKSVQRFLLISQYMPNGSLEKLLFTEDENYVLSWELRYKIALGTACGLAYLHDESEIHIIHCDVKPHNILLDEGFNPFITDFGLARLYDDSKSHVTASRLQGTVGYLSPEYATKNQLSEKVDVYSYGVVLLQLLTGRRVIDLQKAVFLVDWAHELGPSNLKDLMDKRLGDKYSTDEAMVIASVAILCTNTAASIRPRMRDVRLMLEGVTTVPDLQFNSIKEWGSSSHSQTDSSLISSVPSDSYLDPV